MATGFFDDLGVRFEYPHDWELDVNEDGSRTTLTLQSNDGPAFTFLTLDDERPEASELADVALEAMKQEYPALEAAPVRESIMGRKVVGHDIDFVSFDLPSSCLIRCFRTPRRTVLLFAQWSQVDHVGYSEQLEALRRSFKETDA